MSLIIVPSVAGATIMITLCLVGCVLFTLKFVAPETYKKVTKICRKPPHIISADNGRGPVEKQVRAVLAQQAAKTDVFKCWDKDGGGSVSRKEFRLWWPRIGYEAPMEALNDLFDEFDVDGSGEIDEEEFKTAFELRGKLWIEFDQEQQGHDEQENLHKRVADLTKEIGKKEQQLTIDKAAVQAVEMAQEETEQAIADVDAEIAELNVKLAEHQARLDAFKGGIKAVMKKTKVVNMLKAFSTPDEAAVAIQSRVRGLSAKREVQQKIALKKASSRPSSRGDDLPADGGDYAAGEPAQPLFPMQDGDNLVLGSRR